MQYFSVDVVFNRHDSCSQMWCSTTAVGLLVDGSHWLAGLN